MMDRLAMPSSSDAGARSVEPLVSLQQE